MTLDEILITHLNEIKAGHDGKLKQSIERLLIAARIEELQNYIEANLLDGDVIQSGQVINSIDVYEAMKDFLVRYELRQDYELKLCSTCNQMTNHLGGVCQKHGGGMTHVTFDKSAAQLVIDVLGVETCSNCGKNITRNNYGGSMKVDNTILHFHNRITCLLGLK